MKGSKNFESLLTSYEIFLRYFTNNLRVNLKLGKLEVFFELG